MSQPTLFLDRDGTINLDRGYLSDPDSLELISGAAKAVVRAKQAGFFIALITNQAGVAKGIIPKTMIPKIHERLTALIRQESGDQNFSFDDIRVCMHHPDDQCKCRKPETEMLEKSVKKLNSDIKKSFFIGDKYSDLLCASRVGVQPILLLTGHGIEAKAELNDSQLKNSTPIKEDLLSAVEWILKTYDK